MDGSFLIGIIFIAAVLLIAARKASNEKTPGERQAEQQAQADRAADHSARPMADGARIAQDMKLTQTSRIADAVAVLADLDAASPGYRHYCELVGKTQTESSVTAPYSKRKVAYYDLRAFRIDRVGGANIETLVAHEKSIDPFYFTDGSGDQKVYVDIDSFKDNVILVNSANRVEGKDSDFARAVADAGKGAGAQGTGASGMRFGGALGATAFSGPMLFDGFDGGQGAFGGFDPGMGAFGGFDPGMGGFGGPGDMGQGGFDGHGRSGFDAPLDGMPGMGGFFGGGPVPMGGYYHGDNDAGVDVLVGAGLGALLGGIARQTLAQDQVNNGQQQSEFLGYRIVEDVVPLNYNVYFLGEIYRNGPDIFGGRSTSKDYPSSFFATKPEAEVAAALS